MTLFDDEDMQSSGMRETGQSARPVQKPLRPMGPQAILRRAKIAKLERPLVVAKADQGPIQGPCEWEGVSYAVHVARKPGRENTSADPRDWREGERVMIDGKLGVVIYPWSLWRGHGQYQSVVWMMDGEWVYVDG